LEACAKYQELLTASGVQFAETPSTWLVEGRDAKPAWDAFKALSVIPADDEFDDEYGNTARADPANDGDLLFVETSVGRGWPHTPGDRGESILSVSFNRQFSFESPDGEYLGLNGLTLTLEFELSGELADRSPTQIWGVGGPGARRPGAAGEDSPARDQAALEWCAEVEASDAFRCTVGTAVPHACHFLQSDI
jgi:hypothetical protein